MTLQDTNFVFEMVANVAVVASLFYVGLQLRHSTRATRLAAVQAVQTAIGRTEELIIQDAGFAAVLHRGLTAAPGELPDADRLRLNVFFRHTLRTYQAAHYQFRNKALEESVWLPQARALAAIFQADRGLRDHFAVERYMLDPAFVALCDDMLSHPAGWVITSGPKPLSS